MEQSFDYSLLFELVDTDGHCFSFPCNATGQVDPHFLSKEDNFNLYTQCLTTGSVYWQVKAPVVRRGWHLTLTD